MPFSRTYYCFHLSLVAALAVGSTVTLSACGASNDEPAAFGNEATSNDAGTSSSVFEESEGGLEAALPDDCSDAAKLIYLTGDTGELWSFNPQDLSYKRIGAFDCLQYPTHMTVDRAGVAWVVDVTGQIFKASTTDAKCSPVPTWKPPTQPVDAGIFGVNLGNFALSFAGTTGIYDNTLYLLSPTLFQKFDVAAGTVTTISNSPSVSSTGDLTSNGDGTLYFLRNTRPPVIFNINPTTGAKISESPLNTPPGVGGANSGFAFWGGSFWAFESSVLYRYDPGTKTTTMIGDAPFSVTGAGQSTCVPKIAPVN